MHIRTAVLLGCETEVAGIHHTGTNQNSRHVYYLNAKLQTKTLLEVATITLVLRMATPKEIIIENLYKRGETLKSHKECV